MVDGKNQEMAINSWFFLIWTIGFTMAYDDYKEAQEQARRLATRCYHDAYIQRERLPYNDKDTFRIGLMPPFGAEPYHAERVWPGYYPEEICGTQSYTQDDDLSCMCSDEGLPGAATRQTIHDRREELKHFYAAVDIASYVGGDLFAAYMRLAAMGRLRKIRHQCHGTKESATKQCPHTCQLMDSLDKLCLDRWNRIISAINDEHRQNTKTRG